MNPVRKKRLIIVLAILAGIATTVGLAMFALSENINLFYTPTEIIEGKAPQDTRIRAGGLVREGSVQRNEDALTVRFVVTDGEADVTIEYKGSIDPELRPLMGNRVFGCDDCQLVCPWNRFARSTAETDFSPRHGLDNASLAELFIWTEEEFLQRTEGSPIRRAGYEGWLRNLAIGLGNAPSTIPVLEALQSRRNHPSELVREHVEWALKRHGAL